ncbi:serine/threonine-protein kinase H2-like [Osmerus mordax]|uniref:serine/threonine-protein kinase H2-like n=1 Tax=Osmerus mordax TaxID=8014 RepID=UPI00350F8DDC
MGCGSSKVLTDTSKNGYVSFVKSFVICSNKGSEIDETRKCIGKRNLSWGDHDGSIQSTGSVQQLTINDGQQRQRKVEKYRAKFDTRVTARYDIKALIGRGSFSHVVRVEHRSTRHPFAIKMMEVEAPEGRQVCASELAVLRRVRHANVVQLVEVFQTAQRVYMVLELATGGQLLDRVVARGHFTERHATRALQMALAGVAYLHALGITHRNLKPDNLLYYHPGAEARLLVTDFGLATIGGGRDAGGVGGGTAEKADWALKTTCGTPEYMAPEVVLRRPYTYAVDMWAMGVISYILLSGSVPFWDESRPRFYRAIVTGRYSFQGEPWPSVSNLAKDFIERLLASDPSSRMTAAQALSHRWVVTMAAGSSLKNLHRSISQNLRRRASCASSCSPSLAGSGGLHRMPAEREMPQLEGDQGRRQPTTCFQSVNLSLRQVNVGKRTSAPAQARLPWQASEAPQAHILYQAPVPSVGHRKAMAALSGRGVGERTILAASTVWTVNSHSDLLQAS